MFRYVVLVWNAADPHQGELAEQLHQKLRHASAKWKCALARPGVSVQVVESTSSSARASRLHPDCGVVLGTIFHTGSIPQRQIAEFSSSAAERILASAGAELITGYWGNYVAVLHDEAQQRTSVLHGPAGSLPCFRVEHHGVQVFFSAMDDCVALGLRRFAVDWDYVHAHLGKMAPLHATGLTDVSQVHPGECAELSRPGYAVRTCWDPVQIARTDPIEDVAAAGAELNRAVRLCVHSWASCHDRILLNLSGGLDSSIVLGCLRDAACRPRVTCVTEFSPGANEDEREYARLAVRKAAFCTHIERRRNPHVRLERMLAALRSPLPQSYLRRVEAARWQAELAHDVGATAIFTGHGGDQLFCQNGARLCVSEFVHRHGFGTGLSRVAYDAAQLEGASIWSILRQAVRDSFGPRKTDAADRALRRQKLLSEQIKETLAAKANLAAGQSQLVPAVGPGTLAHIKGFQGSETYQDPMALPGDPELVAPLFSQPVMEATLRIPNYVLMVGGWDRGLARRTFADDLPPQIMRRRSKGGVEQHVYELLSANRQFVRQLLLEGVLVQRRVLDRAKVDEVLSGRPTTLMSGMTEISRQVCTEVWLRQWSDDAERAAA